MDEYCRCACSGHRFIHRCTSVAVMAHWQLSSMVVEMAAKLRCIQQKRYDNEEGVDTASCGRPEHLPAVIVEIEDMRSSANQINSLSSSTSQATTSSVFGRGHGPNVSTRLQTRWQSFNTQSQQLCRLALWPQSSSHVVHRNC